MHMATNTAHCTALTTWPIHTIHMQLGLRMASYAYVHVGLVSISRAPFIPILPPGGGGVAVRGVVGWGLEANGFVLIVKRFVSGS